MRTVDGEPTRSIRAVIRGYYWHHIRRLRTEMCQRCCGPVSPTHIGEHTHWHADDDLWQRVNAHFQASRGWHRAAAAGAGVLCPPCFTFMAHDLGVQINWRATDESVTP